MPSAEDLPDELRLLVRRNAIELSDSRWDTDVERLIRAIEGICDEPGLAAEGAHRAAATRCWRGSARPPSVDSGGGGFEHVERKRKRQIAEHMKAAREAFAIQDFEGVRRGLRTRDLAGPARTHSARLRDARARRDRRAGDPGTGSPKRRWALAKGELAAASEAIDAALARSPDHAGAVKLRQDLLRAAKGTRASARSGSPSCRRDQERQITVSTKRISRQPSATSTTPSRSCPSQSKRSELRERDRCGTRRTASSARVEAPRPAGSRRRTGRVRRGQARRRAGAAGAVRTPTRPGGEGDRGSSAEGRGSQRDRTAREGRAGRRGRRRGRQTRAGRASQARGDRAPRRRGREGQAGEGGASQAREEAARLAAAEKAKREQKEQAKREEAARRLELAAAEKAETASKEEPSTRRPRSLLIEKAKRRTGRRTKPGVKRPRASLRPLREASARRSEDDRPKQGPRFAPVSRRNAPARGGGSKSGKRAHLERF